MEDTIRIESVGNISTARRRYFCPRCGANSYCDLREVDATEHVVICDFLRGLGYNVYIPTAVILSGVLPPVKDVEVRLLGDVYGRLNIYSKEGLRIELKRGHEVLHIIDEPELILRVAYEIGRLYSDVMRSAVPFRKSVVIPRTA